MSIQAKGEPAPIVPAAIQIPKAMIPIEIENDNASFMMTSKDLGLPDGWQPVSKSASIQAGLGRVLRIASGGE